MATKRSDEPIYRNPSQVFDGSEGNGPEPKAMNNAAAALREAEIVSIIAVPTVPDLDKLQTMNIDELRVLAKQLDVPDRETITDQDDLMAAIRQILGK